MSERRLTIPQIRGRLHEIARVLDAWMPCLSRELHDLAEQTKRRPPVRRVSDRNRRLTPMLAADIREYARRNPDAAQQEIATHFGLNAGRVSEAMAGKRGDA